MRPIALTLLAAAGFVVSACVTPQDRVTMKARHCARVRARLARDPDNVKLQRFAASYCAEYPAQDQAQTSGPPVSPRCRRLLAFQARRPNSLKLRKLIASECPPPAAVEPAAADQSASAAPDSPSVPPVVAAEQAPAAAPPAVPEKPRELTPEEADAVNEELLP